MNDPVDEHLDKAIASLGDVPVRELEATAEAIGSRRHPLPDFAGIFRGVAYAREGGWDDSLPRFHLGQAVGGRRRRVRGEDRERRGAVLDSRP